MTSVNLENRNCSNHGRLRTSTSQLRTEEQVRQHLNSSKPCALLSANAFWDLIVSSQGKLSSLPAKIPTPNSKPCWAKSLSKWALLKMRSITTRFELF